jgi:phenylpropionate dioxygenase-like ring-hydroxylating dioxygenase large terminal subunit
MNQMAPERDISIPAEWDRRGLPGWTYHSPEFLKLEKHSVFLNHWQIVCHTSDLREAGDYQTLDILGERAVVVRGEDGEIRAFRNTCRHRGSRVVPDQAGHCKGALVCPFHGWVYNLDGTLRGPARPKSFPDFDRSTMGLKPLEVEVWQGFVLVRFKPGPQPSVAELMRPFEAEAQVYQSAMMVPTKGVELDPISVNWKSVRDVDNEGYHVAMAHPALQDLYGSAYYDEPLVNGVNRSHGGYNAGRGRRWSVKHYRAIAPVASHLPEEQRSAWVYFGLFPNSVFVFMPETVQFYQEFPVSVGETVIRSATYRHPEESRAQRLARYLRVRIERDTTKEDIRLSVWSNEALQSDDFEGFYLSDLEYGLKAHHDMLRKLVPVARLQDRPAEDQVAALNQRLAAG